jgi:thiol-disulfide isomerase/thioredoxin
MRKFTMAALFVCVGVAAAAQVTDGGRRFDAQPPEEARALVKRGADLAAHDRAEEAVAVLQRAIALAPDYLAAHREYVRTRAYFQGEFAAVKQEYESLAARNPQNPAYPLALLLGLEYRVSNVMAVWKTVAATAPEWSWGHYARGWVAFGRNWFAMNEKADAKGEQAIAEFLEAAKIDPAVPEFYDRAIFFQEHFGRIDDALVIADRMASRPETRAAGLPISWRLRLAKAKGSAEARQQLKSELAELAGRTSDIDMLAAIHLGYRDVLEDQEGAAAAEQRIVKLDPSWYPDRGCAEFDVLPNTSGIPVPLMVVNQQCAVMREVKRIALRREPDWRVTARAYEALLGKTTDAHVQMVIHTMLFSDARADQDLEAMQRHAERLVALDAADVSPLAWIALALANQNRELPKALELARRAEAATAEHHPIVWPRNVPDGSEPPLQRQQQNYRRQRALALDASGWVLWRMGKAGEAVVKLEQAASLDRGSAILDHLAQVYEGAGRNDEAGKIRGELEKAASDAIESKLVKQPAPDFEFEGLDGKKHRLSEYRGKVVLVTFWATWCGPCVAEMPLFARTREKFQKDGFEVLAISCDDPADREKVRRFAEDRRLPFVTGYDGGAARLYQADGYPLNVFVDRRGDVRYRDTGSFAATERALELLVKKLLAEPAAK